MKGKTSSLTQKIWYVQEALARIRKRVLQIKYPHILLSSSSLSKGHKNGKWVFDVHRHVGISYHWWGEWYRPSPKKETEGLLLKIKKKHVFTVQRRVKRETSMDFRFLMWPWYIIRTRVTLSLSQWVLEKFTGICFILPRQQLSLRI